MRYLALLGLIAAVPASAQSPQARASNTITQQDVVRRINIVANDSMMGRDTPSPGLEKTAAYVASEFRRLGLKPGGDSGTFLQRYPIVSRQIDVASSSLLFQGSDRDIPISFTRDAYILFGDPPAETLSGDLVVIGGKVDPDQIPAEAVKDRIVVWPVDFSKPRPANASAVVGKLFGSGARVLVIISNRDSTQFKSELASRQRKSVSFGSGNHAGPLVIEVREQAVTDVVPEAAQDFERMRNAETIVIQPMPEWSGTLAINQQNLSATSAPNTIGILEGSDPQLRNEYVVYSAHMDHIGITPGKADSINNGADDDGSGTVGVVELAEAFSASGVRPRRSVIFMTVSGEEKGLWGSEYFADHPTVPIGNIVADLNIDMIGRNWKDTIVAIGMEHSDLGATLERVAGQHRDLRMTPIHDIWPEEGLYSRSDHFNFAKKGVPVLFFTSGLHPDYHQVSDSPDKIDGEKEARLLRLLFFLGQDIANAPARPQWNPESYKQIVETVATP
ncbi:MAG TPA: M20/M25/M40 family metallo-hydrolase [Gemmatimonadales bacterium]|jgi:hypothetical protein|nr:M20/M25/M40 family metallo-hydrolase [Gemmatimonadales bacterium]